MNTRISAIIAALVLPLSLTLAGCGGNDGVVKDTSGAPGSSTSPTTGEAAGGIEHPTGADDVVVRIGNFGGFMPMSVAFGQIPEILITGDGRMFQPGATTAQYPGPLVGPVFVGQLTPDQVQSVLQAAKDAGLLVEAPRYPDPDPMVSDLGTTTVELQAAGGDFVHEAYALGFDNEKGARKTLADFIAKVHSLVDQTATEPFTPTELIVNTTPAPAPGKGAQPTETQPWPASAPAPGRDAGCVTVQDPEAVKTFLGANQDTYFTAGGTTYQVGARVVLPGDQGC